MQSLLGRMLTAEQQLQAEMVIAFQQVDDERVSRYGIAQPASEPGPDGLFALADLVEKPSLEQAPSRWAITARYVLAPEIFAEIARTPPGQGGEIQLTDALRTRIRAGGPAVGVGLHSRESRIDVGNLPGYFCAFLDLAFSDPEYGSQARAHAQKLLAQAGES